MVLKCYTKHIEIPRTPTYFLKTKLLNAFIETLVYKKRFNKGVCMELFNKDGQRLYLNPKEREAFKEAAEQASREIRTFCHVMFYTGCRISEILELVPERIDYNDQEIVVRSLKKRNPKPQYRSIPVPPDSRIIGRYHRVRAWPKTPAREDSRPPNSQLNEQF